MTRVFAGIVLHVGNTYTLTTEDSYHLIKVLRLKLNDELMIVDQSSTEYVAKIVDITDKTVTVLLGEKVNINREPQLNVTIFQGLPKKDKIEQVIMRGTEIGACSFVPVAMERSIVELSASKAQKRLDRWQKIAYSAARQAARQKVPTVQPVQSFKQMLTKLNEYQKVIVLFENEQTETLDRICSQRLTGNIALVVGPEGGLTDHEIQALIEHDAISVTLGPRIMRTETAGIAALAILLFCAGDMRRTENGSV